MTHAAFSTELCAMQTCLSRFALRLTADRDDADDLLQETFYRALKNRESYNEGTNLRSWLFTIMKNTFINDYHRERRATQRINTQIDITQGTLPVEASTPSPDADYATGELEAAIGLLPAKYRVTFSLHTQGFKYKEMAQELRLPIGSVKSRIFIARKMLATYLGEKQIA